MGMTERQAPAWLHAVSAKLGLGVPSTAAAQKPENAGCQDKTVAALDSSRFHQKIHMHGIIGENDLSVFSFVEQAKL